MRNTFRTQLYYVNNRTEWTWAVIAMQGFEGVFGMRFLTCGRALKHTHVEPKKRTMLEGFGGPFEARRPCVRLLEACENADTKLDGEEAASVRKFWLARRNARGSRRDYREVDKTPKISGIY